MDAERLGWLGLAWFEGFHVGTILRIRRLVGEDGERGFRLSSKQLLALGVTPHMVTRFSEWRSTIDLDDLASCCERHGIHIVLVTDNDYPLLLRHIHHPPQLLFVRGVLSPLERPIAIVGTRAMTSYGSRIAFQLARELAEQGCEIVSGLALGIDAQAHEGALAGHGLTFGVVAGGCDESSLYPRNNAKLAERILINHGAVMSEFPPGTESRRYHFPLRNRIIAGLTRATVVVEAAKSSGSLITAALALDENREVFAVPGLITNRQSQGTHHLIKLGAHLCTSSEDVLSLFETLEQRSSYHVAPKAAQAHDLSPEQKRILQKLDEPLHTDELVRRLSESSATMAQHISSLELMGLIEDQGGSIYARTLAGNRVMTADDF